MAHLKIDVQGLLANAARDVKSKVLAYALYELADNLSALLSGGVSMDEFKKYYVVNKNRKFIVDERMPGEEGYNNNQDNLK